MEVEDSSSNPAKRAQNSSYGSIGAAHIFSQDSFSKIEQQQQQQTTTLNDDAKEPLIKSLSSHSGTKIFGSRFRYVVATLLLFANAIFYYANNTLYITSIRMVSSDVIESGLLELRAKQFDIEPHLLSANVAAPGTCPAIVEPGLNNSVWNKNATSIAEKEIQLLKDGLELFSDIDNKVQSGLLVNWSISERSWVFNAKSIGPIVAAVPLSYAGLMYGHKFVVLVGLASVTLRTVLFPLVVAHTPFWAVFIYELILGAVGYSITAFVYPLTAKWMLPDEAAVLVAVIFIIPRISGAAANLVNTQLFNLQFNWPACFYLPGIVAFFLTLCWFFIGANTPEESKFVSTEELLLLRADSVSSQSKSTRQAAQGELSGEARKYKRQQPTRESSERVPDWTKMLKSATLWSLVFTNFAYQFTSKTRILWPTYFANILHMSPSNIGLITGVGMGLFGTIYSGFFALATRKLGIRRPFNMSIGSYRKSAMIFFVVTQVISDLLMILDDCNVVTKIISVVLTSVTDAFYMVSAAQLPLDLSPDDSGSVYAYINMFAFDVASLPIISYILSFAKDANAGDRFTWRIVWLLDLSLNFLATLIFVLFARIKADIYSKKRNI